MRKLLLFSGLPIFLTIAASSQNIGINTATPRTTLDVNGDLALRGTDLPITTTYNYALDVNTVKQTSYKLKADLLLGNFILAGITAGTEGRIILLTNRSPHSMELYNEDANANADDRIQTGMGNTLAVFPNGSVLLQYEVPENRWLVKSTHNNSLNYFGGSGGGGNWDVSGPDIYNVNSGNVGIGLANPSRAKLEVNGVAGSGYTSALIGGDGAGLSFQRNWPTIGFNQYRDAPTGYGKSIASGYGMHMTFDPATGYYTILMQDSVGANQSFTQLPKNALTIFKNGKVTIGDNDLTDQATLSISGSGNFSSHFNYGSTGHAYIRGGKRDYLAVFGSQRRPSKVYINDIPGVDITDGSQVAGGDVILVTGGGKVGINTEETYAPLTFKKELGNKISFFNGGPNKDFGIGVQGAVLQFYTANNTDNIGFGWGSSQSFNRSMTFYPGSGQLGVNCLPQDGYHLAVRGKVKAEEIVVDLSGWADYVFADGYRLPSLESVALQIKENKHLPGIPNAATIEKEGLSVGAVQTKMMEKIEELMLYVIEQDKELKALKAELKKFKAEKP